MELTELEKKVVAALKDRDGGIYSNEIAIYAGIDQKSIAGVVSSLVKKNVVTKSTFGPGEEYVSLTEE
jgi:DNA-binding MarR family transcriptional regulator